jgi:hypothetical protein
MLPAEAASVLDVQPELAEIPVKLISRRHIRYPPRAKILTGHSCCLSDAIRLGRTVDRMSVPRPLLSFDLGEPVGT